MCVDSLRGLGVGLARVGVTGGGAVCWKVVGNVKTDMCVCVLVCELMCSLVCEYVCIII